MLSLYSLAGFMSSAANYNFCSCCCCCCTYLPVCVCYVYFAHFGLAVLLSLLSSSLFGIVFVLFGFRFCFWNINDALLLLLSLCITFTFECFCLHFMCVSFTYTQTYKYMNVCEIFNKAFKSTHIQVKVFLKVDKLESFYKKRWIRDGCVNLKRLLSLSLSIEYFVWKCA